MITPTPRVRSLQDEVARDPGAPAFVALADLYRLQGRYDVAQRVCTRGLERNPAHVEAHVLLARIYLEAGDPEKARDEWDIALRLDPDHVEARRALGFHLLREGDEEGARRHLTRAAENDPDDPRIHRALTAIARSRSGAGHPGGGDRPFWDAIADLLSGRIDAFSRESRARLVLVMDGSGRLLRRVGDPGSVDLAALASLAAGIHSASREAARMLGEPGFSQLCHGSGDRQLFLGATGTPAGEIIVVALFGEDSSVGLVRALFREMVASLEGIDWPAARPTVRAESLEAALAAGIERVGFRPASRTS
jgi:hypothetical protein